MSRFDDLRKAAGIDPVVPSSKKEKPQLKPMNLSTRSVVPADEVPVETESPRIPSHTPVNGAVEMDDPMGTPLSLNEQLGAKARNIPVLGSILKGLDAFATNPTVDKGAQLARDFYIPGAGLANIAGLTNAAEAGVAKILPKLGNSLGGRVAQKALSEGLVGAPLGAAQSQMVNPDADVADLAKGAGVGAAFGGVLGAAGKFAGTKLGDALERWRSNKTPQVEQPIRETLGLPNGLGESSQWPRVSNSESPIANPYTFKLPQASEATLTHKSNMDDAFNAMREIDDHLSSLDSQYQKAINDQYQLLKEQRNSRGGVQQGQLIRDEDGYVTDRVGRISNNPQWYQEYYAQFGKVPSNKDLYKLAQKHVDEGYSDNGIEIPSWAKENDYHGTKESLGAVREEIRNSIKEKGLNITDAQLKDERLRGVNKPAKLGEAPLKQEPMISKSVTQQASRPSTKPVFTPTISPSNAQQPRKFTQTLINSDKTPEGFTEKLRSMYKPTSNEETLSLANKRLKKDVEEATSFVLSKTRFTAEKAATAQRLIDHYNSAGNFQRAVDIAEKVSEEATRAGQAIQALSMYDRLSVEGVLIYAQRLARKTNESIPVGLKEVKVTEDMAAKLTGLAQVTQKMTGVKDLSNDVISILERAKAGEKLSESESSTLKRFVTESKQFIQETTRKPREPRPPQQPKDKRVRDNVVSFLDAQEQAAKERLRARGIRISSTPLDVWADYAIIGAAKMAKGTIKLADWSEQMVRDLGEEVRPHLHNLYERSVETFNQTTKKVTSKTIDQAEKLTEKVINSKQLSDDEADSLRSLATKVSGLSGEQKRIASQDLQVILRQLDKPTILKRVSSVQTMGQLLNPKTQVRNALGNELFYRVERLNKLIATPIDIARSKITGGDRTVTFRTNNQGEYWTNWMRGVKAGWKGANVNGLETQYDLASPAFKGKYNPLTYLEKALGASLKSFDTAAYMRAYNNTIGELSTLRAINEGKSGNKELISKYIREADENIKTIADEYGKYATFQDNNIISKGLTNLKKGLNFKQDFGIGDLVLKYPKTPGALLMRALEYSPAGFVRSASILARPWFKKEANTAEVTQALSRAIIGTMGLSGLGYYLMDKGILTGSASKDKDVRDLQRSAGQGQYQINLSALKRLAKSGFNPEAAKLQEGDSLYTYDWMQPISMAISIGANTSKNIAQGTEKFSGIAGTVYNSLEGGLGTLTEQSVLSGVKNAAQGYPGQTVTDKIMDILGTIPSSFVPTAFNQYRTLADNAKRETYSPNKLEQSLNVAKAKIPGLADNLPQQYDTLGRPKTTLQNNNAFNVLLNPGSSSKYELSQEAKWIVDLINESGDESVAPRVPSKYITVEGEKVVLNGDQFSRLQQLQGEGTRDQLNKKYNPSATLKNRVDKVQSVLTDSGKDARKKLQKEMGR